MRDFVIEWLKYIMRKGKNITISSILFLFTQHFQKGILPKVVNRGLFGAELIYTCRSAIYHKITTSVAPGGETPLENFVGKGENTITRIFSFSHGDFYPFMKKLHH